MAFKRHFARVGAAERCTESIFTDHQRQVCDYALVYKRRPTEEQKKSSPDDGDKDSTKPMA